MLNALTMTARSLRLATRSPDALLTAPLLPVMLMVVFVNLFGGAVRIGTSYVSYVVPGVLLLFVIAVSWLAAVFGLLVSSAEAAGGAMFIFMFFSYASSAFVPVRTLPWWLRGFAGQPAGHPGDRDHPRAAAQAAGRRAPGHRAGLVRRPGPSRSPSPRSRSAAHRLKPI